MRRFADQSAPGSSSVSASVSSGSGTGDWSSSSLRSSSRGCVSSSAMKVLLPDDSELELADGATGLDAAAAIGPKLAEQAVLVRSNGAVQDLRLPLRDGQQIQILTTRDADDPDALAVLRHSSAHLLAEAVRRLYPGVKIAIGPPIENGFHYAFDFPEPIGEEDLARVEAEIQPDVDDGRECSPGAALWHPKGMALWNALEDLRRSENARRGYLEVKTPLMWDLDLWRRSGHLEKYGEHIFRLEHGERTYGLKPMNCPGHMLVFNSRLRSYRELPLRLAEAAVLHRDEPTGTLQGLTRARQFSQDDAHVFCTEEQIEAEIDAMFDYVGYLYDRFGVRDIAHAELATRPDDKLGTDADWDRTEGILRQAVERQRIPYRLAEGEGAFYGPKIDFFMDDALGRPWQMGTIQLDGQQPARLGCTYVGPDNREHMPYVIHRALFGSLERFVGILIEHYGGAFPFWLAPVQVRVIPVGEGHRELARQIREWLEGYRVEVDERDETVGKRIRDAEVEKVPYVIVAGDRESRESLAVRRRGGEQATLGLE